MYEDHRVNQRSVTALPPSLRVPHSLRLLRQKPWFTSLSGADGHTISPSLPSGARWPCDGSNQGNGDQHDICHLGHSHTECACLSMFLSQFHQQHADGRAEPEDGTKRGPWTSRGFLTTRSANLTSLWGRKKRYRIQPPNHQCLFVTAADVAHIPTRSWPNEQENVSLWWILTCLRGQTWTACRAKGRADDGGPESKREEGSSLQKRDTSCLLGPWKASSFLWGQKSHNWRSLKRKETWEHFCIEMITTSATGSER